MLVAIKYWCFLQAYRIINLSEFKNKKRLCIHEKTYDVAFRLHVFSDFFGAARIFYLSQSERLKAKDLAVEIAAQKVQFTKITDFYWFNTEETYYSLAGISKEGQQLYAIVSPMCVLN